MLSKNQLLVGLGVFSLVVGYIFLSPVSSPVFAQDDDELAALFGDLEAEDNNAANTKDAVDPLAGSGTRGYIANSTAKQTTLTASSLTFSTPIVLDSANNQVRKYAVRYGKKPLGDAPKKDIMQKTVQFSNLSGSEVSFTIEGLQANTTYHVTVSPVAEDGKEGRPLPEFVVSTPASQTPSKHGVADLNLANVSYTYEGNNYTVSWTPVDGAEKVQIYLKSADAGDYVKQPDVSMNAGIYKFTASKKGDYLVKMIPVDSANNPVGSELVQTIKVNTILAATPETKEETIQSVPKVGPGLNLMIGVALFGILIYMLYRSRVVNK